MEHEAGGGAVVSGVQALRKGADVNALGVQLLDGPEPFREVPGQPSRTTPSAWEGRCAGSSLGSLRSTALARVNSLDMLAYPCRVPAKRTRREPSSRVSFPPVMGWMPRLPANRANSSAPQRLVSVSAREA